MRAFIPQTMPAAYDCGFGLARLHLVVFSGFDENPEPLIVAKQRHVPDDVRTRIPSMTQLLACTEVALLIEWFGPDIVRMELLAAAV